MTDHIEDRLLKLAEKATPGPWNCLFGQVRSSATTYSDEHLIAVLDVFAPISEANANGDYLAHLFPEVVAAMCRVVETARVFYDNAGPTWGGLSARGLYAALAALDAMEGKK